MSLQPPLIDPRKKEKLFSDFLSRARFYLPEWNPNREQDVGAACGRIFFEMHEEVKMRLNQMPEKSLVAFLDSLGIDLLPEQSAKAWVAFTAIPNAPDNANVITGSEISGKGKDANNKDKDASFQTLKDLAVSPAVLKELISVHALTDEIFSFSFNEKKAEVIYPFSGVDRQEHSLYIAHPHLFNVSQKASFSIDFQLNSGVQKDIFSQDGSYWFMWEYFNETYGNWIKLGDINPDATNKLANSGKMEIHKMDSGEIPETMNGGIKSRWIRCRALPELTVAIPRSLPEITTLTVSIKSEMIEPEMAFNNNVPLDVGIKAVPLLGIETGKMWLRSFGKGIEGEYRATIAPLNNWVTIDDKLQFEDGSEWNVKKIRTDVFVFLIKYAEIDLKKMELSIEYDNQEIEIRSPLLSAFSGNMILTGIIDQTLPNNFSIKCREKDGDKSITLAIFKDLTLESIVYDLIELSGKQGTYSYSQGTSVRLITAIRDTESNPLIAFDLSDSPDLSESRYVSLDKPGSTTFQNSDEYKFKVDSVDKDFGFANVYFMDEKNNPVSKLSERFEGDNVYLIPQIKPFGDEPFTEDIFYLACNEAFSKKNASITIAFTFALNGIPESEDKYKITANVTWEYWNGDTKTWHRLSVIDTSKCFSNVISSSSPGTRSDWNNAELRFICPEDIAKVKVNGEEKYWIRARIIEGDFGRTNPGTNPKVKLVEETTGSTNIKTYTYTIDPIPETHAHYPIIKHISIAYITDPEYPSSCLCLSNADYKDVTERIPLGNVPFLPFEELPEKRDALFLSFDKQLTGGPLRLYFHLKKEFYDLVKADVEWNYWNGNSWIKLAVDDTTEGFRKNGYVEFFSKRDFTSAEFFGQSRFWLKVIIPDGVFPDGLSFDGIYFNAVEAIQSSLISDEQLGASDGTADQNFKTIHSPIIDQEVWVREPSEPDEEAMHEIIGDEPDDPLRKVTDNGPWQGEYWVKWHYVEDFDNTGSDDRHYRVDRRTGTIYFGDGEKGMIPPKGAANIKISYHFGGGVEGNVEIGAISSIKSSIPYIKSVTNPFKAEGGAESETTIQALLRGSETLQHRNRAVTAEDFERITLLSRAVARARCLANIDDEGEPNPGWISMLIIPVTSEKPPAAGLQLISNVKEDLKKVCVGTIGAESRLDVRSPKFINIRVEATLVPKTMDTAAGIVNGAVTALNNFFDPIRGGLNGTGWEFGGTVCRSAIIALLEDIDDVEYTKDCRIYADDVYYTDDIPIPFDAVTVSSSHSIDLVSPDDDRPSVNLNPSQCMDEC